MTTYAGKERTLFNQPLSRMLKNPGNTVKKACSANLSTYLLANIGNF
jgi:hypothetical protein